eukprot:SAG11_NODE_9865_length_874_cov_1.463226_1_plen_240_part_01
MASNAPSNIGMRIPATPSQRERQEHDSILRSSDRPRRGSTGSMLLAILKPPTSSPKRARPAPTATAELWNLNLAFLDTPSTLRAFVNKQRSSELAEIEKQLSLCSDGTVLNRKKVLNALVAIRWEWVRLACLQYFWSDIIAAAEKTARTVAEEAGQPWGSDGDEERGGDDDRSCSAEAIGYVLEPLLYLLACPAGGGGGVAVQLEVLAAVTNLLAAPAVCELAPSVRYYWAGCSLPPWGD